MHRPEHTQSVATLGHEYDHYDPAFALDPHGSYAQLRQRCPVVYSQNYGGYYVLTKFADIFEVLTSPDRFSSWPADTPQTPGHNRALIPLEVDQPEHKRYRRLVDPLFRPKALSRVADSVRANAAELIDAMVTKGEFDFMTEFAQPFPSAVFLRLVGLDFDAEQRDQLCGWAGTILHTTTVGATHGDAEAQVAARMSAGKELHDFLRSLLEDRMARPRDDLLSHLIEAEFAGERKLDVKEILNFAYVLVLAGLDTVTTALGFSFMHLAHRPDLQDQLAADPALIPAAVQELLRYESIVHMTRTVLASSTIGGTELRPGDRVCVALASGNRDETEFDGADEIRFDRKPRRHLIFGAGNHRCLGSSLAILELTIAFEEIMRRIPRFSLPPDAMLAAYGGQTRSLATLPFRTWREQ
ncbi:MAG TPA: cytochrome P450 [Pseudonocardia sp.]|jgi:cytochrome P450